MWIYSIIFAYFIAFSTKNPRNINPNKIYFQETQFGFKGMNE